MLDAVDLEGSDADAPGPMPLAEDPTAAAHGSALMAER